MIVKKRSIVICILILSVIFYTGCGTTPVQNEKSHNNSVQDGDPIQKERRFYEESGGFSIIPPETWQIEKVPSFEYRILRKEGEFIVFVPETFKVQFNMHVDLVLEKLNTTEGENFSFIQRGDFVTLRNIKGEKIIYDISMGGQVLRFFNYFLPGKDNVVMIITCATIPEKGHIYNELFDKTVETFEWTDPSD